MKSVFRQLSGLSGIFLLALCITTSAVAQQNQTLDSLKRVLKNAKNDTVRITTLLLLTEACELKDMVTYGTESIQLCEKGLASGKGRKKFYLENLATSLNNTGYYYSRKGAKGKALEYYKRALAIDEKLGDKQAYVNQLGNIAAEVFVQGDFSQAIEYNFKCLKIQEELGDKAGMAYSLNSIGYAYTHMREYQKALEYNDTCLRLAESIGDKQTMAETLHNSGLTYNYMKEFQKALDYYNQSYVLFVEMHHEYGMAFSLSDMGGTYLDMGDNKKALEYLTKALELSEKNGFKLASVQTLFYASEALINEGKINEALPYARKGFQLAKELQTPREIEVSARTLKTIYEKQHKFKEAFEMLQLEITMRDSVVNEADRKNAMRQELQYQFEKKELQAKLVKEKELSDMKIENERKLARRNTILYIVLSLAALLGISIFFLYKFYKQRNIINASRNNELRRKLLLNQMNPHFIFNSVDNIQSLIHNKQDKEAISYLGKFSKLTRQILENSNEESIPLSEELNTLENYLTIQQLLYNNSFTFRIEVEESIDKENVFVPPMLTQPFVENAIKHGLKNKKEGGSVNVKFYMKEQSLFFEVSDNGSGLEDKMQSGHKSMSTRIVTERLNTTAKKPIEIMTKNLVENNEVRGVITTFEIPYICDN